MQEHYLFLFDGLLLWFCVVVYYVFPGIVFACSFVFSRQFLGWVIFVTGYCCQKLNEFSMKL